MQLPTSATSLTSTTTTTAATSTATTIPPPATLAHVYANIHANSTMLKPADGERLVHSGSSAHDELHSQYSLIAVVILTTLFLTITVSTTGLLLAFCKKKNTVFSLQKSEQDSQFEMDDLEKTDTESCHEDLSPTPSDSASQASGEGKRRSATCPNLHSKLLVDDEGGGSRSNDQYYTHHSHPHPNTASPTAITPLVCRQYSRKPPPPHGKPYQRTKGKTSMRRSLTVAAIHHSDEHRENTADSGIRIHVEDMDSRDDLPDMSFGHLALQLERDTDTDSDDNSSCHGYSGYHDSDLDDSQNDQTVALLKC
nr:hypothetical protein BaRGS_019060 [Batillaria attramentaria]